MKTLIKEFGKEFARIFLLAIIPVAISQLESGMVNYQALAIVGVIAVLKGIDKGIHEVGKENDSVNLTKGLVRF